MHSEFPSIGCTALVALVTGVALYTDLRSRRIPNWLTFPAVALGILLQGAARGWEGAALSLGGAIGAPILLLLLHFGRGLGMGDLKLAAAVGAILGPALGLAAMLLTALTGGVVALVAAARPGGVLAQTLALSLMDVPWLGQWMSKRWEIRSDPPATTIPYGVAIGLGSLLALVVFWCTADEGWLLWLATHAVSR